jgi:hypothetical protein
MTPKEYRHHAEECLKLANETNEIFARIELLEMAAEFRAMAQQLELRERRRRQRFISGCNRKSCGSSLRPPLFAACSTVSSTALSIPPPALGGGVHRSLARRRVAVRWAASRGAFEDQGMHRSKHHVEVGTRVASRLPHPEYSRGPPHLECDYFDRVRKMRNAF